MAITFCIASSDASVCLDLINCLFVAAWAWCRSVLLFCEISFVHGIVIALACG
ncbi:hypothetical protein SynNOUM97013_01693 [Synechococcus sp. NOUM97013]|nr:hypothetical protein SynNOUM97013_01693 [Synechococcus sp. NOUM97013]